MSFFVGAEPAFPKIETAVYDYDPRRTRLPAFHTAAAKFRDGSDTPRAFLERGLEILAAREPVLQAFAALNIEGARQAADEATARYKAGKPLSPVDGMAIGVKDLYETKDMPTQYGSTVFAGHHTHRDAACVYWLRRCGAIILGKTTTPEFAMGDPIPTRNPFNEAHTAGGTSSGSACAVGAGIVPAALGTQVKGSLIRPANYCANYGFKPSHGALNRGGDDGGSATTNHLGTLAASIEDAWTLAHTISTVAGPQPGFRPLDGDSNLPAPVKPKAFVRIDTLGWKDTDDESRATFEAFIARLKKAGMAILTRDDHPDIAAFDDLIAPVNEILVAVTGYEMRWPLLPVVLENADKVGPRARQRIMRGETVSLAQYQAGLAWRLRFREAFAKLSALADGVVCIPSPGPAPHVEDGSGDSICQLPFSLLGAPVFTLPFMAVRGLPFGLQTAGFVDRDHHLAAYAAWLDQAFHRGEL
jgi:Asp-tRNA(Asn)/Glu-tRNA(Gln) amidotransferase A subunit family amidase